MGTSKFLAGAVLGLATTFALAQDARPPAGQSSSQPGHHSTHHVQVPVDDGAAQPVELTAAEAAIEKKDYSGAEPLLHKLVERDPANYEGWFDLGFVENALGKVDDSIAAYRKSVAAKPDVFESNLNLGLQLAKTDQPDAEKFLRAATLLKPTAHVAEGQYRAWLALGHTVEKARPEEAVADYQRAAALQPKEAEPHLSAGLLLEQANKFADAEQEYKQALALDSGSVDAVTGLANIYMRGRRLPEAEDYLRKLLVTHSDSGAVHVQLGRVLAAEGKKDTAIGELQAGVKLAPGDDAAQRDLADLYLTAGKNELAEAAFRGLLASHPNDADIHYGLGKALLWQKKSADAQRELITTVKLKPSLGTAYYDLAFAANDNKDYPVVIRALDVRAKLQLAETPMTYFLRASAYDHLRDFKNAATNFHLFLNVANGKFPNQEWQAKHRLIAIEPKK
ncbi:MAG: tetratricopeptide repeat protein [Candidatus Sulfotelmatobacter sp.]